MTAKIKHQKIMAKIKKLNTTEIKFINKHFKNKY